MSDLIRRRDAAQATLGRFLDRPLAWGRDDCVRMAAFHLREMGHKVTGLAKAGSYKSLIGAQRALLRTGFATIEAAVDAQGCVFRIAPAAALPGDLFGGRGDGGEWTALGVVLGNGRILGFQGGFGRVLQPRFEAGGALAWRVV